MNQAWSVRVFGNPGIVGTRISPHFYFWRKFDDDVGSSDPILSTKHTQNLSQENPYRIYVRIITLFRLINGIRILNGSDAISASDTLVLHNGPRYTNVSYEEDLEVFLEELTNPFDAEIIKELRSQPFRRFTASNELCLSGQMLEESVDNPIAREILLWLALGDEEILYFIINAYKIMDSIKTDIRLSKTKENEGSFVNLDSTLDKMSKHKNYMNTKAGSGPLGRHGTTTQTAPKHAPTIIEIKVDLKKMIVEWFKLRFVLNGDPSERYISKDEY